MFLSYEVNLLLLSEPHCVTLMEEENQFKQVIIIVQI